MSECCADVVVLGSGFAGSLAAMLLAKQGRSVCLMERGKHPRFAIGESSTPLADFKLQQIAGRYDLPQLAALSRYGTWMERHPNVMRGAKRGFAYFFHRDGHAFHTDDRHASELLVTANSSRQLADTHWLRSDVDALFVDQAIGEGVNFIDEASIVSSDSGLDLRLHCDRRGHAFTIRTRFLIVATGNPQLWSNTIATPAAGSVPRTNTRCLFAHFANVKPWRDVMHDLGFATTDHPFDCDQSALHQVFDGGWMWQLRFDDQTTSAGFLIDNHRHASGSQTSAHANWQHWMDRYPSIAHQFAKASVVRPESGLQQVERLQQPLRQVVGSHWALLPAAVGFSDPLFSTGIAHAIFSVEKLTDALRELDHPAHLSEALAIYSQRLSREIDLIDRLVSLAYRASCSFEQYVVATMPYFAATTTCERRSRDSQPAPGPAFLLADDPAFLSALQSIETAHDRLRGKTCETDAGDFENQVRHALKPFNQVGLFASTVPGMYRHTAAI